jgi:hypothetical protein
MALKYGKNEGFKMNKLNKKEKLFTFQNFAIILLLMAIIYLIAFYFWNMYEEINTIILISK